MHFFHRIALALFSSLVLTPLSEAQPTKDEKDAVEKAGSIQEPTWVIKTNPFSFLWGPIPFTSEYRLHLESIRSRYQSMELGISYLGESPILSSMINMINSANASGFRSIDIQVRGARLQASHKFYLKGVFDWMEPGLTLSSYAPNGYYLTPKVSMAYASFTLNNQMVPFMEMTHLNANLLLGRQMFFWGTFAADIFIGGGYKRNIWEVKETQLNLVDPDRKGLYGGNFRFVLGMNLGLYF